MPLGEQVPVCWKCFLRLGHLAAGAGLNEAPGGRTEALACFVSGEIVHVAGLESAPGRRLKWN